MHAHHSPQHFLLAPIVSFLLQLCAHQHLQPRALCSILHNLASLVCRQQQKQQEQQQQQDEQYLAAGLPQPLLQKLLAATQLVLEEAAAAAAEEQQGLGMLPQHQSSVCQCTPPGQHHLRLHTGSAPVNSHPTSAPDGRDAVRMQMPGAAELHAPSAHQPQQQLASRHSLARPPRLQQQEALTPAGLVTLADAFRRLQMDPPGSWQAAYVAAAHALMRSSDARNLPLMLAPCVRWRWQPGRAWLQQYLVTCHSQLPMMHRQVRHYGAWMPSEGVCLGGALHCCIVAAAEWPAVSWRVPELILTVRVCVACVFVRALPVLPSCMQGLAVLGHSLTALQVQPSAAWLSAYLAAAESRGLAGTPAGCSYLLHTLGTWRQMGCLRQPAAGAAGAAHAAGAGGEGAVAAAAGQQLQSAAQALAGQCLRCFMEQGHSFTAEQLGMFCKGLAQWGMRGTPQLAGKLEQVCGRHCCCC